MKLKSGIISISLLSILSSTAQESDKTKLVFNGISFSMGALVNQGNIGSISDFQKLAKGSKLLEEDFSSYDNNVLFYNGEVGSIGGIHTYFKFVNPSKVDQKIFSSMRIGISFTDSRKLSRSYSKSDKFRVDTLISNQTGQAYFIDSTATESIYMDYGQSQVFLSAAYFLGSNPEDRWAFYSGVGLMAGYTIDSYTYISKSNSSHVDNSRYDEDRYSSEYHSRSEDEYYKNDNSFSVIASLPIGVDFRIGKKRRFWSNSHLAAEFQPSLYYYSIPELDLTTVTTASVWGLTYKYMFR
jgi:hypothetical protein